MNGLMGFDRNTCIEIVEMVSLLKVDPEKPYLGMLFSNRGGAHILYKLCLLQGFGIVRRSSNMGLDGKLKVFYLGVFTLKKGVHHLEE